MEPSLLEFARTFDIGPIKVIRCLCRAGYLKRSYEFKMPTEKAKGLLGVRTVVTNGGKRKNHHRQVFVTDEGIQALTEVINAEQSYMGPWEIKR